MCGIVGYTGPNPAAPILLGALHDLEYRGYDSAGIAILSASGDRMVVAKREGKIANLEARLAEGSPLTGTAGIGHTRWATHGMPSDANAHPHLSCHGEVVVIHNGIVENYSELRSRLRAGGHTFASETDTETIVHLMEDAMGSGATLFEALRLTCAQLEGSQAVLAMSASEPGVIAGARLGNAGGIVIGYGEHEMYLASDLAAIVTHTTRVAFLADGELVRVDREGATFAGLDGTALAPEVRTIPHDPVSALKGQYQHFMLKEIMEQPEALADTIHSLVTFEPPSLHLDDLGALDGELARVKRVVLLGMGTSLHAATVGRRYIEALAGVPAEVENASEFRYREPILDRDTLVISVSQSGETVDVLEAMAVAKRAGALQVTICNTEGGQTTRVADGTVYTRAGLERGVASTKCFVTAMAALYCFALRLGEAQGATRELLNDGIAALARLPDAVARALAGA